MAFDRPEPTFRHEAVGDYKANREAAPDILRQQMGLVRQVLEALGIPILEAPGFEADDIIATLATEGRDRGDDVVIVTGDRDTYQLVEDPHIKVLYNRRGVSDYALYDEAGIKERTGVTPAQYPQYAALRGDPSDNLPGVPGVGEKTAAKLINTYGGLDGIFANLEARHAEAAPEPGRPRGPGAAQRPGHGPRCATSRSTSTPDDLTRRPFDAEEVREALRLPRVPHAVRPAARGGGGAGGEAAPAPSTASARLECGDGHGRRPPARPVDAAGPAGRRAGRRRWRWRPRGRASPGRSPLAGLAFVTSVDPGEAAWLPGALLADAGVRDALPRARWPTAAARSPPTAPRR